jgi:PAS domain S-box-containing protein
MTVGIDILASDWKASLEAARRGPFFSMATLALLLILGAAAIHRKNRQMKSGSLKLKSWIFVPMVLALGVGCLVYGIYQYHAFREVARNNMFQKMEQFRRQWNRNIISKVQILKLQAESITHDSAVLNAWQAKDREALAMLVGPDFERLKKEHDISRYCFIEPDGVCLLRVHQPEKQGDLAESFTLKMAEQSGSDFWGVELDPWGSLTLSYVRPVQRGGTLIGFLKLEIENGPILQSIASEMHLEILVSLRKEYITAEKFEASRQAFDSINPWESYPDLVIIQSLAAEFPGALERELQKPVSSKELKSFTVRQGSKRFLCGVMPLFDIEGRDVARLFILEDRTLENRSDWAALWLALSILLALSGGLMILLWSVVGSAEHQLENSLAQLKKLAESYRRQFSENSIAMLLLDPKTGNIVDANTAACRFYGYPKDRLMGMCVTEINALPAFEVLQAMASVLPGQGRQFEFQHRLANGSLRDVTVSASIIQVEDRTVLHTIIHDITDRKRAEKELAESQHATMNILEDLAETTKNCKGP